MNWQGSGRLWFGWGGSDGLGDFDRILHLGRDFVGVTLGALRVKLVVYFFANEFCAYARLIKRQAVYRENRTAPSSTSSRVIIPRGMTAGS